MKEIPLDSVGGLNMDYELEDLTFDDDEWENEKDEWDEDTEEEAY
ncbi:MAG: hypothetical protein ABID38_00280 [Candidatus Diapherotrites archaeon]